MQLKRSKTPQRYSKMQHQLAKSIPKQRDEDTNSSNNDSNSNNSNSNNSSNNNSNNSSSGNNTNNKIQANHKT